MQIVNQKITLDELNLLAKKMFDNMVKTVVDIKKNIMAVDAEMHADEEATLLENGSNQNELWGINIYPDLQGDEMIELDSMINSRPSQNNRSRGIHTF